MDKEIKNILVLKIGGIGDLLLITPALRSLKESYPNAGLYLLTGSKSAEIVNGLPYVNEFVFCDEVLEAEGIGSLFSAGFISGLFRLRKLFKKNRFDVFIEFQNILTLGGVAKPFILSVLSGANRKLGFDTEGRGFFLTEKLADSREDRKHVIERNLELVGLLGCDTKDMKPEISIDSKDFGYARNLLVSKKIEDTDFVIGVHAGANPKYIEQRSWLPENFASVIDKLTEKYGAKVILFGGEDERDWIKRAYDCAKFKPINLAGETIIKQTAALIKRCNFFLANDSGLMHIAVVLGVPTVGIFGCGDYGLYGTYPPEFNFTGIWKEIKPAYPKAVRMRYDRYMQLVSVDEVMEACIVRINTLFNR